MQDCVQTEPKDRANTAFLGRQPIFLPNLDVYGYELLFRSSDQNFASIENENYATASVVLNSVTELGLDVVAGSRVAFINMTRSLLLNSDLSCLPEDRVVLEVLENISPDKEVLDSLTRLAEDGYTIEHG